MRYCSTLADLGFMVILAGSSPGCTLLLDIPEPVAAHRWCLDADPAKGLRSDDFLLLSITDPSGAWMRGCKCYCPADHAIMLAGANGELAPGSSNETWYGVEVGLLRGSAASACDDRVSELEDELGIFITFDHPETISCLDAVADETPYLAAGCVADEDLCPPGDPGGFGTDGYVPGTSTAGATGADGTQADGTATTDGGDLADTTESTTSAGSGSDGATTGDGTVFTVLRSNSR
jgi:hypothetical protein